MTKKPRDIEISRQAALKMNQKLLEKFGSQEALNAWRRKQGKKGGQATKLRWEMLNQERKYESQNL